MRWLFLAATVLLVVWGASYLRMIFGPEKPFTARQCEVLHRGGDPLPDMAQTHPECFRPR